MRRLEHVWNGLLCRLLGHRWVQVEMVAVPVWTGSTMPRWSVHCLRCAASRTIRSHRDAPADAGPPARATGRGQARERG